MHRIPINTVEPGVPGRPPNTPESLPYSAVTLESGTKSNLPQPITLVNQTLRLHIRQFVPERTAGSIPKTMESHPRGFHVRICQSEIALQTVQNGLSGSMNAEVLKGKLKIRNVRFYVLHSEHFPAEQRRQKEHVLGDREHQWA
eukprot:TRINITY_DN10632_c0_g1_i1.p3 TRINITY_DN10632_c0_g1~~TRINITY_DN10632_c0_g1_i1.p3  ORF type:complete len:144 (-),score=2.78 TRINITY_DN10632_c0_g1_i1:761-1192(-)